MARSSDSTHSSGSFGRCDMFGGYQGVGLRSGAQRAAVVREAWGDVIAGAAPVPVRDRLSGCCKS